jgi:RNA polymerase sigma-70 factor (ECF subfamily)
MGSSELDDLAQEAARIVLLRLAAFHGLSPFEAWIHQICVHTLLGARRRRRRQATATLETDPIAATPGPERLLADRENHQRILALIDRIGGAEAEVMRLFHVEGHDFAEIAAITGIAVATLRTRYYRGLEQLRRRLQPPTDEQLA